jgi:PQQ enzyme-like repeat protein
MKFQISTYSLAVAGSCVVALSPILPVNAQMRVNVTQYHNDAARTGLYIDTAFTPAAAANLRRDPNFDGTISGEVYAQPLYIEGGPTGRKMIIVVTESNNVYALDAMDGSIIWQLNVGAPVSADDLACTKIDPLGITGTPIVDRASRALFLNAMTTPDGGRTKKHLIYSLNVDTGDINSGWPVDVGETVTFNGMTFNSAVQGQRGALGILGNILHVPYGSLRDCNIYHGWLLGVPLNNPGGVTAWATSATGGGIWGVSGVASDGVNLFVTTGNTFNTFGNWGGGEAIIRFQPGPIFSWFWAPRNWLNLDSLNSDLGSSGPLLVDVPGATPSNLVVAVAKSGTAYLLNRDNLGGISAPIAASRVAADDFIIQAAATYQTNQGTYVVFRVNSNRLTAFRITATNPPAIAPGWSVNRNGQGCGSPFVTSTDGSNNMIVWIVGTEGDQRLHGYNGDTRVVIYDGGGPDERMGGTHSYSTTGIVARGRIYVATDNKVYAFAVPTPTPTPVPTPTTTPTPPATPTPTPTP